MMFVERNGGRANLLGVCAHMPVLASAPYRPARMRVIKPLSGRLLLVLASTSGCSLFGPSEGYTLTAVNGQAVPATVHSDPQLTAMVLGGRLELLPRHRFRISYLHRFILYDGERIERDTTGPFRYSGFYTWTDSTLKIRAGSVTGSYRGLDNKRILRGLESIPFLMAVEFVRDP